MPSGRYIICSGGEGSGKSTLLGRLAKAWPQAVFTREPGAMEFGQEVRSLILEKDYGLDGWTQYYLFMADRANHMAKLVQPALAAGRHVISDRGYPETFVYQLYTQLQHRDPAAFMREIVDRGWPAPDLWILLDLDPAVGLKRRSLTGLQNVLDKKTLDFHQTVRQGFLDLARAGLFPTEIIDAGQSPDDVFTQADLALKKVIS